MLSSRYTRVEVESVSHRVSSTGLLSACRARWSPFTETVLAARAAKKASCKSFSNATMVDIIALVTDFVGSPLRFGAS